ncbi:hypothetical protein ACFLXQ_07995, partial [Chloroflexota bacterium]
GGVTAERWLPGAIVSIFHPREPWPVEDEYIWKNDLNDVIAVVPVIADSQVYVETHNGLAAISQQTGSLNWQRKIDLTGSACNARLNGLSDPMTSLWTCGQLSATLQVAHNAHRLYYYGCGIISYSIVKVQTQVVNFLIAKWSTFRLPKQIYISSSGQLFDCQMVNFLFAKNKDYLSHLPIR